MVALEPLCVDRKHEVTERTAESGLRTEVAVFVAAFARIPDAAPECWRIPLHRSANRFSAEGVWAAGPRKRDERTFADSGSPEGTLAFSAGFVGKTRGKEEESQARSTDAD
jgi:hypothetical protein